MMTINNITYRADYTPPNYWIDTVDLTFHLHPTETTVTAITHLKHRHHAPYSLALSGDSDNLKVKAVILNGNPLDEGKSDFKIDNHQLTISHMPVLDTVTLTTITTLNPTENTTLMGLYASQGNLFTQCEAEGFRRISYFLDRPDVMARYTVTLIGDKTDYPVLLSNGNLIESGDLKEGINADLTKHYAIWQDPYPKPSYLFAMVAGDLAVNEAWIDNPHVTSGKSLLQIYVRPQDLDATQWALESLKASIAWDYTTFGRPLDLERYMIVAVADFNMGAMENKGLNIFNTAYVLAQPEIATDTDYANIEAVIGHEYFHNWTGNRITCRDWFQLTLKEGLTVYRDQEFSADQACANNINPNSAKTVRRIDDVMTLRTAQFGEDSGPMAHSVRPDSYEDISNFYTATVYEKGAEIIRMQALIANEATPNGFRLGMDTYFNRYDGQAVTCDDFVDAIEAGSGADLNQFKRWYEQAGTPTVSVSHVYDNIKQVYSLTLTQTNPPVGIEHHLENCVKPPLHIPIKMALFSQTGTPLLLNLNNNNNNNNTPCYETVLHLKDSVQTFVFENVVESPIPSLLREFSAPIRLNIDYSDDVLATLLAHETDAFNRFESGQRLYQRCVYNRYSNHLTDETLEQQLNNALMCAIKDDSLDPAFKAQLLSAPSYNVLSDNLFNQHTPCLVNPNALFYARESLLNKTALFLHQSLNLHALYKHLTDNAEYGINVAYNPNAQNAGYRSLYNMVLSYWIRTGDEQAIIAAKAQYDTANNMTNRMAGLNALLLATTLASCEDYTQHAGIKALATHTFNTALSDFYERFKHNDLVIDKWFALQATQPNLSFEGLNNLINHPDFKWETPNRMRSVIFRVCMANPVLFHDQQGYTFWLNSLQRLIKINPDVAARLARALESWKRYDIPYSTLIKTTIEIALNYAKQQTPLPNGVIEVLSKALA